MMNQFANRLAECRKKRNLTQAQVAENLSISFQAVSLWERGETYPEIDKLVDIAELYQVSLDWLLNGTAANEIGFDNPVTDGIFNTEHMYTYIKTYASAKGFHQTLKALPFAREAHQGQVRKGKSALPYIDHPLTVTCHGLALGLEDDPLLAAALLHDVCEDCDKSIDKLPIDDEAKEIVALLTKDFPSDDLVAEKEYYAKIAQNPKALIVKLLDRCCNISEMSAGFSAERIAEYINETEEIFYPLMQRAKTDYPQYNNQIFLINYHIRSVISTCKHLLTK